MHFIVLAMIVAISSCSEELISDTSMFDPWSEPTSFTSSRVRHDGQFSGQAQGIGWAGEHRAWSGVGTMTCRMDKEGYVDLDVDVDTESISDEVVTDVDDRGVVIVTEQGIAMLDPDGEEIGALLVPNVVDGRHDGGGNAVALVDDVETGCSLLFITPAGETTVRLPGDSCDGGASLAVDRATGTVYVATSEGVVAVTPEGWEDIGIDGDYVAWDAAAGVLYVAKSGATEVSAYSATGVWLWTVDVGQPVTGLASTGDYGGVVATVMTEDGNTELIHLDAKDGRAESWMVVHENVYELALSPSGRRLAIVTDNGVDYFTVSY